MIVIELNSGVKFRYRGSIDIRPAESFQAPALWIEAHDYKPYADGDEWVTWASDTYDVIFLSDIKSIWGED